MDTQVIVAGAGPVGLMLAAELRLGGADVVVVERLATPTTESRASTLHARTMEIFAWRGLLERFGGPPNDRMGHFGGIPLDLGHLATRFPGQWKVLQARVEEVLAEWATGLGADIRRGHELVGLTAGEQGVRARISGPAGEFELTAAYLVGCDGEDSAVRRLAGIASPGRDAAHELLRSDVAGIDVPNRRFERLPNGLAIAARRPDGVTRVMVSEFGRQAVHRARQPSFEDVCMVWKRVTGEDISGGKPLWVNAFGDTSRLARRYRDGRVLLAGDAAHRQLPAGGQAINLGLQDAVNLGWKLAAEVTGHAPAGLLDTYHTERHEVGARVLRNIEAQALLLLGGPEVEPVRAVLRELIAHPAARDRLAGMITGLDVRYEPGEHPLTGDRLSHVDIDAAGRPGRGLLLDRSADPARLARLRGTVGGRVDVATPNGGPAGLPDTVLLRPDGYVAWAGDATADPRPALRRWFG